MIQLEGKEKNIFTAQDSMDKIDPIENGVLNLEVPSVGGLPDLLYSNVVYDTEKKLGIELPVDKLLKIKKNTAVLIGVSGCGKTRSCYDLCRHICGLYFDCSADLYFLNLIVDLKCARVVVK